MRTSASFQQASSIVLPNNVTYGSQTGIVANSNIVQAGNAWYVLIAYQPPASSSNYERVCLFRSLNILDATAWKGWDGVGYEVVALSITNPSPSSTSFCAGVLLFQDRFDLRFNSVCNCWIILGETTDGWTFATSYDLINRTNNVPIALPFKPYWLDGEGVVNRYYPSLLDLDLPGADINFQNTGATPYLYYLNFDNITFARNMYRVQVRVRVL